MKNVWKIVFVVMLISIFLMSNICFASAADDITAADDINAKGTTILSAILWVGYAIALGMVVFIGIKYILGAADAKANMKSAITNWLIGAFIVFMCTTIAGWVVGVIGGENTAQDIIDAAGGLTGVGE